MGTISMTDVAALARVSKATVSRALNAPTRLDAETLARVRSAIETLGYVPDGVARSLRTQRTMTIGMSVPTLAYASFCLTVETIQGELAHAGYSLLLSVPGYDEAREAAELTAMIRRGVDGMILVGGRHDPSLFALLKAKGIPYVIVWSVHPDHPSIGFDHRRTMVQVATALIDLGHTRIGAIMTDQAENERVRERLLGIGDALAARHLPFSLAYQRTTSLGLKTGGEAMAELMALPEPPTAVICVNDVVAAGAVLECQRRGLSIPGDVSIVGFSASELGSTLTPSITSVETPVSEMGERAVRFLLERMAGGELTLNETLPTPMVLRQSMGPPSHRASTRQANARGQRENAIGRRRG